MKLKSSSTNVVNTKTQGDFNELMRIYAKAGWQSVTGENPKSLSHLFLAFEHDTMVSTKAMFTIGNTRALALDTVVMSLEEFKEWQGIGSNIKPEYYKENGYEAIDIIEAYDLNFNRGNVIKYLLRAGKKDDELQDLKKAEFYIKREIGRWTDK